MFSYSSYTTKSDGQAFQILIPLPYPGRPRQALGGRPGARGNAGARNRTGQPGCHSGRMVPRCVGGAKVVVTVQYRSLDFRICVGTAAGCFRAGLPMD